MQSTSSHDREQRTDRFLGDLSRRIGLGLLAGAAIGAVVGLVAGLLWFPERIATVATAVLGGVIVGLALGAFWAGMSRLESPQPGLEPSQTDDPWRDEGLTTEERTSPRSEDR